MTDDSSSRSPTRHPGSRSVDYAVSGPHAVPMEFSQHTGPRDHDYGFYAFAASRSLPPRTHPQPCNVSDTAKFSSHDWQMLNTSGARAQAPTLF